MKWSIEIDPNEDDEYAILLLSSKIAEVIIWVEKRNISNILDRFDEDVEKIKLGYCGNKSAHVVFEKNLIQIIIGDLESWDMALTLSEKELIGIEEILSLPELQNE